MTTVDELMAAARADVESGWDSKGEWKKPANRMPKKPEPFVDPNVLVAKALAAHRESADRKSSAMDEGVDHGLDDANAQLAIRSVSPSKLLHKAKGASATWLGRFLDRTADDTALTATWIATTTSRISTWARTSTARSPATTTLT